MMTVSIPVPATGGYINIGDLGVLLAGLIFGLIIGFISGGVGSVLADIFLGFPIWAPATFLVKR
ncbi:MAG: ECF transporter S component [Promethearchaeota archaeon]